MIIKGRAPALRHVQRTHRINLDWLFERVRSDPSINLKFVSTKLQLADLLTKGQFTADLWNSLCRLLQVGPPRPTVKGALGTPLLVDNSEVVSLSKSCYYPSGWDPLEWRRDRFTEAGADALSRAETIISIS